MGSRQCCYVRQAIGQAVRLETQLPGSLENDEGKGEDERENDNDDEDDDEKYVVRVKHTRLCALKIDL